MSPLFAFPATIISRLSFRFVRPCLISVPYRSSTSFFVRLRYVAISFGVAPQAAIASTLKRFAWSCSASVSARRLICAGALAITAPAAPLATA